MKPDGRLDDDLLHRIRHDLHEAHGIEHATIQFEQGGVEGCGLDRA